MDIMNFITRPHNTIEMIVYILIIIILSTVLLRLITYTMRHLHKKEDRLILSFFLNWLAFYLLMLIFRSVLNSA